MRTELLLLAAGLLLLLLPAPARGQEIPPKWLTDYEKSGGTKTPRYAETMAYCRLLEKNSRWINVTSFGKTAAGRDLPLMILSKERAFTPKDAQATGKAIVLVQNGIHAGEIDGKDACLMLARDIAILKTKRHLLDHAIVLIIPIYNVDGHERVSRYNRINQNGPEEMGWRVTAQNLNLNRDYMKADAPETQAWLRLFTSWLPDFFVDCHVTDGADFQHVATYGIEVHANAAPQVRRWLRGVYLPVLDGLRPGNVPLAPYIFLRDETDPRKGVWGGTSPPRFSTGYTALQNRPGLLIETHMLKDYRSRVEATYLILDSTLALINRESETLRSAVQAADLAAARNAPDRVPLDFTTGGTPSDSIHYFGYVQHNSGSDISGATRISYTREPFDAIVPRYDSIGVTKAVTPPFAYLIPQQWTTVVERLRLHGVALHRLKRAAELDVEAYRFRNARWDQRPYEGRHPAHYDVETIRQRETFPAGTVVVFAAQRARNVALHALEPEAPDAFAAWGFFDAVFEQKEYAEGYVMETVARELLVGRPELLTEFEQRLKADSAFAASPFERINFFYQHSPYWDPRVNLYPVVRLLTPAELPVERLP